MSKYQEALENIGYIELNDSFDNPKIIKDYYHNEYKVLQQLVVKTSWIPIEERAPLTDHRVLVQLSNYWQQVAYYDGEEWVLLCDEYEPIENRYRKVIAWMELPDVYKKDIDE